MESAGQPKTTNHVIGAGGSRPGTVLDVAVRRIQEGAVDLPSGRPVRPIWLPPLPAHLSLGAVLSADPSGAESREADSRKIPIGLIDRPERQRQDVLGWDRAEGNGNLLIVGAGRSGKSTALATLLLSAAMRYSPTEMHMLCVDLDGSFTRDLEDLPHVAAVASRSDPELLRRIVTHVLATISNAGPSQSPPGLLLVIDDWTSVLQVDPALEDQLEQILTRGPGAGVHVVITAVSALQIRGRLLAGLSSRIELRLADPFDSAIDRRLAARVGHELPGQGTGGWRALRADSAAGAHGTGRRRRGHISGTRRRGRGPEPLARAERRPDHHAAAPGHPDRDRG